MNSVTTRLDLKQNSRLEYIKASEGYNTSADTMRFCLDYTYKSIMKKGGTESLKFDEEMTLENMKRMFMILIEISLKTDIRVGLFTQLYKRDEFDKCTLTDIFKAITKEYNKELGKLENRLWEI